MGVVRKPRSRFVAAVKLVSIGGISVRIRIDPALVAALLAGCPPHYPPVRVKSNATQTARAQ